MKHFSKLAAAGAIAAFMPASASALPASIFAQHSNGYIYTISTVDATAVLYRDLDDLGTTLGQEQNSPNALGYGGGQFFRTDFGDTDENVLLRDNQIIVSDLPVTEKDFQIAAGDVVGDTYYYVDRNGALWGIGNIFSTNDFDIPEESLFNVGSGTLGDIAIRGNDLFVSVGSTLKWLNFTTGAVIASLPNPSGVANGRFAGLAFAGNGLFGFDATGSGNSLFEIGLGTNTFGDIRLVDEVTGGPDVGQFTDAAAIPLPAAGWLLIVAAGGLVAAKRRRAQAVA